MPDSTPDSRGLIGNAVIGSGLAWTHRRQVLAVVLPILAPALLGVVLLDVLLGRDRTVIVNGVLTVHGDGGGLAWAKLGLTTAAWLLALIAGSLAVVGAARGRTLRPLPVIGAAGRRFPVLALGLCAVAGATALLLRVIAGFGGLLAVALVLAALAVAALVAARMLVGTVARELGGSAWKLTRGRVTSTAGAFLLGGVAVPLLLASALDQVRLGLPAVLDAALLTVVVATQGGILAHVVLLQPALDASGPPDPAAPGEREFADLAAVDARLAPLAGGPPRRAWAGAAAMLIAVLLPAGVAVANPYGAPSVRWHDDAPAGGAVAAAWPAGQHPVIVTTTGARFCDNDVCDRYVARNGGPAVLGGRGTAGIGPDGAVVRAAVTGGKPNGGPFIHYARCTRQDGCRQGWLPVRASAREPFGWPELAVSGGPDGAVWFAVAMPSPDDRTYRMSFIRCADADCSRPQRHPAGTLERTPADGYPDRRRARLSVGADGRPVATLRTASTLHTVSCEPVTCANPRTSRAAAGPPDARWTMPAGAGEPAVSLRPGLLKIGDQRVPLPAPAIAPGSGAVTVAGSRVYATAATSTTRPSGFHVTVGTPATHWQQMLWRCERSRCRRHRLDVFQGTAGREALAVGADGRILLVRDDRVTLTTLPADRSVTPVRPLR